MCLLFSCLAGKLTRRGSTDTAGDVDSIGVKHCHSHHNLPDHSNSHSDNTIKEGGKASIILCFQNNLLYFSLSTTVSGNGG